MNEVEPQQVWCREGIRHRIERSIDLDKLQAPKTVCVSISYIQMYTRNRNTLIIAMIHICHLKASFLNVGSLVLDVVSKGLIESQRDLVEGPIGSLQRANSLAIGEARGRPGTGSGGRRPPAR